VFDLGRVLVQLRGTPIRHEWFPAHHKPDDIWLRWLTSDAPRLFESGQIGKDEFASKVVDDLQLSITPGKFLEYFAVLPKALYDGVPELLASVRTNYKVACFSNSNELHWDRCIHQLGLGALLDQCFSSHQIRQVKPDLEGFRHVIDSLDVAASQILFFDDMQPNVDAAIKSGMRARKVVGIEQLSVAAEQMNLLES